MWLTDWFYGLIERRIANMKAEIESLVQSVEDLKSQNAILASRVAAEVANSTALKAALDAAVTGQLAADDLAALTSMKSDVEGVTGSLANSAQALSDSTAVNSPGN